MWCEFVATDVARVYRCRVCGFTIAPTFFPPARIRRACRQWDPGRVVDTTTDRKQRGLGDTIAWCIDKLSFGRMKGREGCGCQRRREWLNRLVPYRRALPPGLWRSTWPVDKPQRVLLRFPHGLGDAVQLTTVLLHLRRLRPEWQVDVEVKLGATSLFTGLAERVFVAGRDEFRAEDYVLVHTLAWHEPDACYRDSPSSKAERSLREAFHIVPQRDLCRYQVNIGAAARGNAAKYLAQVTAHVAATGTGRFPAVVMHYQGNSARRRKNLDEQAVRRLVGQIVQSGFIAIVLDFESPSRSAIVNAPSPDWPPGSVVCPTIDHPLWGGTGTGDGETIAALIAQCSLFIGIDSGPGHIAAATETPSVIVWTGHHPLHYCAPSTNVLHLMPERHEELLRGRRDAGLKYFEANYAHRHYRDLNATLPRIAEELLSAPAADPISDLIVDGDCWVRRAHRAADMVIVRDVDGRDAYRLAELRLRPRTVLDVGAHIGCFAARARRRWPAAEMACVEPNPANLPALRRNVGAFARVFACAATYSAGPVRLASTIYPGTDNTGGSHVIEGARSAHDKLPIVAVEAMNLEQLLAKCEWPTVDLLKLDCEGCEFSLLEHAELERIGAIVGEYHDRARFDDLLARRFAGWEFRRLTDGQPGLFWLINPSHMVPREA